MATEEKITEIVEDLWPEHVDSIGSDVLEALVDGKKEFLSSSNASRIDFHLSFELVKLAVEFVSIAVHVASAGIALSERRQRVESLAADPKYRGLKESQKNEVFIRLHLSDLE
jgi:hypothetical protein